MNRADLTEKILDIKREKGWSWKYRGRLVEADEIFTTLGISEALPN